MAHPQLLRTREPCARANILLDMVYLLCITMDNQDAIGFLGCKLTLLAHTQFFVHQYTQVLLSRAPLNQFIPQPVLILGIAPTQVQELVLCLVELHEVCMGPLLKPVKVPLDGVPSHWCRNCTTQLSVICKLAEGSFTQSHYVIYEAVNYNSLGPSSRFFIHLTVHPSNPYLSKEVARMLGTVSKALQKSSTDRNIAQISYADKEFVWSLWKRLQVSNPDLTQAVSLVVEREKQKAEVKDRRVLEILQAKDSKIETLEQRLTGQQQEINNLIQRKIAVDEENARLKNEFSNLNQKFKDKSQELKDTEECAQKKEEQNRLVIKNLEEENKGLNTCCADLLNDLEKLRKQEAQWKTEKSGNDARIKLAKFLKSGGTVAHGALTLEQVYPEGLQPVEGPHTGAGEKCEEERVAKGSCYGLPVTPHSPSPRAAQQEAHFRSKRNLKPNDKTTVEPPVKRSRSLSPKSSFRESEELRKLKIAERKIENLEKTLQLKTQETDELRAAHEKRKERLQMLQTNYRALKEQLKQWEEADSRLNLEEELDQVKVHHSVGKFTIQEFNYVYNKKGKVQQLERRFKAIEGELKKQKEVNKDLLKEKNDLNASLKVQKEDADTRERELEMLRKRICEIKKDKAELLLVIDEQEKEAASLKRQVEEANRLRNENEDLLSQVQELKCLLDEAKAVATSEQCNCKIAGTKVKLKPAKKKSSLGHHGAFLKQSIKVMSNVFENFSKDGWEDVLTSNLAKWQQEKEDLQGKLKLREHLSQTAGKSEATPAPSKNIDLEMKQLQCKLKNSNNEITKQSTTIKSLKNEVQEKEERIRTLQVKISRLERDLNMKRHLIEDLRSRLKANQENEKTSNETLESLERKVKALAEDCSNKKASIDSLKQRLNVATKEKTQYEQMYHKAKDELEKKDLKLTNLESKMIETECAMTELETTASQQLHGLAKQSGQALESVQKKLLLTNDKVEELMTFVKALTRELQHSVQELRTKIKQAKKMGEVRACKKGLSQESVQLAASILNVSTTDLEEILEVEDDEFPFASYLMDAVLEKLNEKKKLIEEYSSLMKHT
ncbi:hypothetical protein QYF61_017452, partial [Mycteria americana]